MTRKRVHSPVLEVDRRSEAGFTMAEVMVSLVIFIIAVVGLVAMESRGIEAQRASMEIREAEANGQDVMAEMMATGFDELVERNFAGNANAALVYDDFSGAMEGRVLDYRAVPMDGDGFSPGQRPNFYWIGRRVTTVPDSATPGDPASVEALLLEVFVLWLDYTNPAHPPPLGERVPDLRPENIDSSDADFKDWVAGVRLQTIRVNEGSVAGGGAP